jgi:hypothetical protein
MVALRNMAISLLHRGKEKNIAAALSQRVLNPKKYFPTLGVKDFT